MKPSSAPLCLLLARPASARRAPPPDAAAANDAPANEAAPALPLCVLTAAQREGYRARALALPEAAARKLQPYIEARSSRALQHVAAAWAERARIVGIEVDGAPITHAELDDALPLMTWCREVLAQRALPERTASPSGAPVDDAAAQAAIVADVAVVCEALALRGGGDVRRRAVLTAVRRERRAVALGNAVGQLLVLCDEPTTAAWLARLPKGEAAAVARLREALPAWERRVASRQVAGTARAVTAQQMAQRASALAMATVGRLVRAGRYLAKGEPARERLWRAYKPAKKRVKAPTEPTP